MLEKRVTINGQEMKMRTSALIPRLYRGHFGRDMIADMRSLISAYREREKAEAEGKDESELPTPNLEVFENAAWLMLHYAGEDVGKSPEEWLESIDGVFDVYSALPTVLELWHAENATTSVPRKK